MALPKQAGVITVVLLAALLAAPATAPAHGAHTTATVNTRTLLRSRQLWATIDICSPSDQPDTVGIRGSMPDDGRATDKMYMSFRLQYLSASKLWIDLVGAKTAYEAVGSGMAREGGTSFGLVPVAGKPASRLRGVVDFQWRMGKKVLVTVARATTAGHRSVAEADPSGFSAATCLIG